MHTLKYSLLPKGPKIIDTLFLKGLNYLQPIKLLIKTRDSHIFKILYLCLNIQFMYLCYKLY